MTRLNLIAVLTHHRTAARQTAQCHRMIQLQIVMHRRIPELVTVEPFGRALEPVPQVEHPLAAAQAVAAVTVQAAVAAQAVAAVTVQAAVAAQAVIQTT